MSDRSGFPERRVVISGVGKSTVGRRLGVSPMSLTLTSIAKAVADAGLTMGDIDGLATFPGPVKEYSPGFNGPDLWEVQDALRLRVGWSTTTFLGAGPPSALHHAIMAVGSGLARHAVVYRTMTESSGQGQGSRQGQLASEPTAEPPHDMLFAVGGVSPVGWFAMYAHRYMHQYGMTREQLAWVAVSARRHATRYEGAVLRDPMTVDDYLNARMISTPLGLFDCDLPIDGSVAVIVSAVDTAADLRAPVRVEAIGGGARHRPLWEQWDDLTTTAAHDAAAQMWSRTDLVPADVDVAELYDGFSILSLIGLEAFGFCGRGEAASFVEGGARIDLGGELPVNTYGGQLSAGRLHGYGALVEAVEQLRGEAAGRQVEGAEVAAVGGGGGPMGFCFLLTR